MEMSVPLTKEYLLQKKSFLQGFAVKNSAFSQSSMCFLS